MRVQVVANPLGLGLGLPVRQHLVLHLRPHQVVCLLSIIHISFSRPTFCRAFPYQLSQCPLTLLLILPPPLHLRRLLQRPCLQLPHPPAIRLVLIQGARCAI
jgi:hypothetical protein